MPQLFQVLRCYKCFVFQVHLTKKSNKWDCKICGEKQSIKRHYGLGTAKDCRIHVQKLNGIRGEEEALGIGGKLNSGDSDEGLENSDNESNINAQSSENFKMSESKWLDYVENTEKHIESNTEEMYLGNSEVVLEIPKKRMKKFNRNINKIKNTEIEDNFLDTANEDNTSVEPCNRYDKNEMLNEPNSFKTLTTGQLRYQNIESQVHLINKPILQQNISISGVEKQENNVTSLINKHSKWAQFVQEPENYINNSNTNHAVSQPPALFSLCHDSELDDVLNF